MLSLSSERTKLVVVGILVLGLTTIVSSASVQHHPFSEIFPPDENLGFGGYDIENVSGVELSGITPYESDIVFRDAGNTPSLVWDESAGEWRLNGVNLNASGNSITNLDSLDGGNSAINVNNILEMNSNSINGLNNLGFNGGATYIIQNSDGDNILVQADSSGGSRNNYIIIDPDSQLTSFPTGNVQIPNGNLNMGSNSITNFFGSPCPTGEAMVTVNDDGSFGCVDVTDEVESTYVNRAGDSMTGTLDMTGNNIIGVGNLGGSNIVNTNNIAGDAVTSNELDETDSYNLGWNNLAIAQNDISVSNLGAADANLDMNGNSVTNFFGSPCPTGEVMVDVNSDGSYDCVNAADEVQDTYVNRNGDSMTGNLDMQGNDIVSPGLVDGVDVGSPGNALTIDGSNRISVASNSIAVSELDLGSVDGRYVQLSGDVMSGSLDMNGNSITNFFGAACSDGNVAVHVNDDGSLDCVDAASEVQDTYVNRNGDSMTGSLDMSGNNVNGVSTINNGGSTVNTGGNLVSGGTVEASADLRTGSGVVTSSVEMCIGNQC